ncbi:MAG: hypothetical protein ACRBN8_37955 [Nannocystales bacterium]
MEELRIVAATPEYALGWAPSVMLYVWRAATTIEAARASTATILSAREASPTGRGVLLGIVEERTPPPAAAVRREIAEAMSSNGDFVFASALVFEGGGFQGSMVRMVAAGLSMLSRLPFPHHVFDSVSDGALWLERASAKEPTHIEAATLEALIAGVRQAPMTSGSARAGSG